MTLYLAGQVDPPPTPAPTPAEPGTQPVGGLVHHLLGARTACGRTPASTWRPAAWTPPVGCCKTCAR